jgi:phospholipid-translocating ATPase
MLIISALLTIFSGYATTLNWYIMLIRFILVLTWIIPISLRVNLDISKMIFSHKINNDKKMTGCLARNSNIPE